VTIRKTLESQHPGSGLKPVLWLCLIAFSGAALGGCSTFGAYQAFTYRKTRANENPSKVFTYTYDPQQAPTTPNQQYFKDAYTNPPAGQTQKLVRNRILYELMGMVDDYYYSYTAALRRDVSGKGIIVDTTALATSIASTAAGGKELKTVLSAISSSVQGISKSIDANVLLGNTVQAIRLQMDGTRADLAAEMIKNMKALDCTDYPLEAGLRDIVRYYDAGTLTSGVASLSKDAGVKKENAEKKQTKAAGTKARFTQDTAADKLSALASTEEGKKRLRSWMNEHDLKDEAIAEFIWGDIYATQREEAVTDLLK
jgi:hypothetical protein